MRDLRPSQCPARATRAIRSARTLSTLALVGATLAVTGLGGCAIKPIEPWVKPYERERLADPIMLGSLEELPGKQRDHVYSVREGAHGATGVQGGGCGCN